PSPRSALSLPDALPICWVIDAFGQSLEHGPAGNAHHVAGDVAQLDVRPLQQLLHALNEVRALLDQGASVADQFPPLTTLTVGNEAGFEQPMLEQLSQPLSILDVG